MKSGLAKRPLNLWIVGGIYPLITFAYGILNSLLILYLHIDLHLDLAMSYGLFAIFNALIFTLPIIAGYLADYFGYRETTIIGMLLCLIGLFLPGSMNVFLLKAGLAAFALGLAMCATTLYCILDASYSKEDPQRESDFTLFYMMFNVGFFVAILVGGFLARAFGFERTIEIAGVIVFVALIAFIYTWSKLQVHPTRSLQGKFKFSLPTNLILLTILFSFGALICIFLMDNIRFATDVMFVLIAASIFVVLIGAKQIKEKAQRWKLLIFLLLCILSVGFWALYMLEPSLLTIFIQMNVGRSIFGTLVPASTFYSLDSIYIIILGFALSYVWRWLALRDKNPSIPTKFTLALFSMGLGYCIFAVGILTVGETYLVNVVWIFLGYIFLSLGELLIAPTGLAMVGRLSPPGREGLLMGMWQLYTGFSAIIAVILAELADIQAGGLPKMTNPIFSKAFLTIGSIAIVFGIIVLFITPKLKKMIGTARP